MKLVLLALLLVALAPFLKWAWDMAASTVRVLAGSDWLFGEPCMNTPQQQDDFRHVLAAFREVADAHGLTWWLDWGTLLGAWRIGDVLPYDHDADIGYLAEQRPILEGMVDDLAACGVELHLRRSILKYKGVKLADIEPWTRRGDKRQRTDPATREGIYQIHDAVWEDFPAAWVEPLWEVRFLGDWYPCPNHPERLLKHRYPTCRIHMRLVIPHRQTCWICAAFWRTVWRIWGERKAPLLRRPV